MLLLLLPPLLAGGRPQRLRWARWLASCGLCSKTATERYCSSSNNNQGNQGNTGNKGPGRGQRQGAVAGGWGAPGQT